MTSDGARDAMSSVVRELVTALDGEWTQRVPPSTGPCSDGGVANGLEWADDWYGAGVGDSSSVLDAGEGLLDAAGFTTERRSLPAGMRLRGINADGRTVVLDVGTDGQALIIARSACFPDPDA